MRDTDRLFARIVIQKNFATPAAVEEARRYLEKLEGQLPIPLSLGVVLQKLGKLTHGQIQAVQKDMDADYSFTCAQCGLKGYRLEFGDGETRCERCRSGGSGPTRAAGTPQAPASARAPAVKAQGSSGSGKVAPVGAPAGPGSGASGGGGSGGGSGREGSGKVKAGSPTEAGDAAAGAAAPERERARRRQRAAMYHSEIASADVLKREREAADRAGREERAAPAPLPPAPPGRSSPPRADLPTIDMGHDEVFGDKTEAGAEGGLALAPSARPGAEPPPPAPGPFETTARRFAETGSKPVVTVGADGGIGVSFESTPGRAAGASGRVDAAGVDTPSPAGRRVTAEPSDPLIGKVIGGARIERMIGRGGMGTVYRAHQLELERTIAIKILSPALTSDPKQVAQFFREAKALARLEHPNIVTIYNVGKEDDLHFIQMQYVEGGSLENWIQHHGRLSIEEACRFVEQAAKGLLEAHTKGITHRDVKPENMLVSNDVLKVTDFGLARMEGDAGFSFASGRIVGTPFYMSPEQIDGRNVDTRTDIYALGATFYYLLTGEKPFVADTPVEILLKHVNEPLRPPREHRRDIPDELSRLVCKMMVKDPNGRYQSLKDVLRDLDLARRGQSAGIQLPKEERRDFADLAAAAAIPLAPQPIAIERPRSFYYMAGGLALAAVIAIVVGIGPLREIMADGGTVGPRASMAEQAAEADLRAALALEGDRDRGGPKAAVEQLRKLAERKKGMAVAERALAHAAEIEARAKSEAERQARNVLAEANQLRQAGRFAAALEALGRFPSEQKGYGAEAPLLAEAESIRSWLRRERGVVYVPSSPFRAGEGDDARMVDVDGFYIDVREVSNRDWHAFMREAPEAAKAPVTWGGSELPPPGTADLPVTGIGYEQAKAYAAWAKKRLPTAIEWEKAARGPESRVYPWGDEPDVSKMNCYVDGAAAPALKPVDAYPEGASPYGCLNMAGNAAEWVVGEIGGIETPVIKGGGFLDYRTNCRGAFWTVDESLGRTHGALGVGFRCAQTAER